MSIKKMIVKGTTVFVDSTSQKYDTVNHLSGLLILQEGKKPMTHEVGAIIVEFDYEPKFIDLTPEEKISLHSHGVDVDKPFGKKGTIYSSR